MTPASARACGQAVQSADEWAQGDGLTGVARHSPRRLGGSIAAALFFLVVPPTQAEIEALLDYSWGNVSLISAPSRARVA